MIERNLERLKPEEQAVLEAASVAGAEFSAAAVAAALERPQNEVEACCTRLSRHEQFFVEKDAIAWPDGTVAAGFGFKHAMYQELYGFLPPGHRVQLHRRIAAREEAGYGERSNEIATELAHHYSFGNDKNNAIHYLRLAGERAVARGAAVEAEAHYRRALELLSELPQASERDRLELTGESSSTRCSHRTCPETPNRAPRPELPPTQRTEGLNAELANCSWNMYRSLMRRGSRWAHTSFSLSTA
jgi:predicted ATPase